MFSFYFIVRYGPIALLQLSCALLCRFMQNTYIVFSPSLNAAGHVLNMHELVKMPFVFLLIVYQTKRHFFSVFTSEQKASSTTDLWPLKSLPLFDCLQPTTSISNTHPSPPPSNKAAPVPFREVMGLTHLSLPAGTV